MYPFSFIIYFFWVFFFFFLVSLAKVCEFCLFFSKNQLLILLTFSYYFSILFFIYFCSDLCYLLSAHCGLCFSSSLRCKLDCLFEIFPFIKNVGIYSIKFPLRTAFVTSHKFWYVVFLFWKIVHVLLRRICILLLFNWMSCTYLLGPFDLKYSLSLVFPYWFSVWMI